MRGRNMGRLDLGNIGFSVGAQERKEDPHVKQSEHWERSTPAIVHHRI
jgi:hypothetical protein